MITLQRKTQINLKIEVKPTQLHGRPEGGGKQALAFERSPGLKEEVSKQELLLGPIDLCS